MIKELIIAIPLLVLFQINHAQILKVDKGSIEADSSGYFMGSTNLDFNINNRSTTTEQEITFVGLQANADLVYVAEKHAYILINKINYFKSTGGPLLSTGYTHFRINFLRKKKVSYESFSQVQYDDGRMMPLRLLQGGGIRIRLGSKDKTNVFIGLGAMYEHEHWKSPEAEDLLIRKSIWKTSDYINGKFLFNEYVGLNVVLYYQGGYDHVSEVFRNRISSDIVLTVKITGKLSFLTTFTTQYEDKPIIPINNFVYSLTNGLKWDF